MPSGTNRSLGGWSTCRPRLSRNGTRIDYDHSMAIHIALVRGINVGGRNRIAMADLRELAESLGFDRVQTVLQSGNLIFDSGRRTGPALEQKLEAETANQFNVSVDYVVRTAHDLQKLIDRNPFPDEAEREPSRFVVVALKDAPNPKNVRSLEAAIQGPERVRAVGKQLYIVYPKGQGRSKLTNAVIERTLGLRGTARNWNTMLKLQAQAQQ